MKNKLHILYKEKGFLLSFILSIIVLIVFFGDVLWHPNSVYFGVSGDGMQTYYNSLFHVKYDTSYLYQEAMNYPFKESVFFTACHPIITNFIKFFGLAYYTIGILNLTLLLSLPISVWFLYFILKEFKVHFLISAIAAVAIGYLTPQVARLNSHYTLAYSFAIPAMIYLIIKFYNYPSFKKTILISILVFLMAITHMYFFVFYAIIIGTLWVTYFYTHGIKNNFILFIKHFSLQLLLPLILIQIIVFLLNDYTDRTNQPFGFLIYISNWSGVFYPYNKYYEYLFKNNGLECIPVDWEGIAFVGFGATIISFILFLKLLRNILNINIKHLFQFTSFPILNGLIIGGVIAVLYSFGWPFIFGHEDWVDHLGFFKQTRSLGRFAWIFFYIINIGFIVIINDIPQRFNKFYFKTILISFLLFVLCYDSYMSIKDCNQILNNTVVELNDRDNELPEDTWVNKINPNDYQAILAFPYFHVGSENISIEPKENIHLCAYIASLKTGLPIIPVMGSRLSLSQTYQNLELIKEPNGKLPEILTKFKNQKNILLIFKKDFIESEFEKRLIALSNSITETPSLTIHNLNFQKFKNYYQSYAKILLKTIDTSSTSLNLSEYKTDSLSPFIYKHFESLNHDSGFVSTGDLKEKATSFFNIFNDSLKCKSTDSLYIFSFWFKNFQKDQYASTTLSIEEYTNGQVHNIIYGPLKFYLKQLNNNWAMIECKIKLQSPANRIKVDIWNPQLRESDLLEVDNVLFRKANVSVFQKFNTFTIFNNCIYYRD